MRRPVWQFAALLGLGLCAAAWAQLERPVRLGEPMPRLDVEYVKGTPLTNNRGDAGKIQIVEFWATWCKPCHYSIPHLSELQAAYGDRGLEVLGISNEEDGEVLAFLEAYGDRMEYRVAVDRNDKTSRRFRREIDGIPRAYLFNEAGILIWAGHPLSEELEELIRELTDELQEA